MSTSRMQQKTSWFLSTHFGRYRIEENKRPDWLITNRGERLELDFYIEDLFLAIEVQGEQHYRFIPFFHKTYDGFRDRLRRDQIKANLCSKAGITLIEIYDEDDLEQLYQYLPAEDPEVSSEPTGVAAYLQGIKVGKHHECKMRKVHRSLNLLSGMVAALDEGRVLNENRVEKIKQWLVPVAAIFRKRPKRFVRYVRDRAIWDTLTSIVDYLKEYETHTKELAG